MYVSIWLCIGNILSSFLLWIPSMNKQKPHDICTYLSIWLASWLSCTPTLSRHSLSYLKPALHPKLSSFFHRQGWKSDLSFWNILPKFTFFWSCPLGMNVKRIVVGQTVRIWIRKGGLYTNMYMIVIPASVL